MQAVRSYLITEGKYRLEEKRYYTCCAESEVLEARNLQHGISTPMRRFLMKILQKNIGV